VAELSVDAARAAITDAGLEVNPENQVEFSDTIAKDLVIGLVPVEGAVRPGDTVQLVVSKGPQPIEVPNVIGMTIRQAVNTLNDARLKGHSDLPGLFWDIYKLTSTDPASGATLPPGSLVPIPGFGL